ncbi:molecular chaperone TorD family protein [Telmatospirillum sp.]|uniref:TorD/DmsD family molecular chaperone n=1 Tax=Telmatospirillum sp. TaxID=2079197 RepID=UPI002848106C|nr:molecular chaperone TorD family protein [Telmatospirillum sp.]MDR3439468.1 molecular chaperone TorD family protein [Telmatospirillum sp.]
MTCTDVTLEDCLRADLYGLLANLLSVPPGNRRLSQLVRLEGDSSALGLAVSQLAKAVEKAMPDEVAEEYNALFIGVSCGEVVPYASFYLMGSHEHPLTMLRQDMVRLGIVRTEGIAESEDHISSLFEMMRGLIEGTFVPPAGPAIQSDVFLSHIAPWAGRFFDDLETAPSAQLYRAIGAVGSRFMAIEIEAMNRIGH